MTASDPARLATLARTTRSPRLAGIALAAVGVLLALVRWRWLPAMPRALPVGAIALALGLIGLGHIRALRFWLAPRR